MWNLILFASRYVYRRAWMQNIIEKYIWKRKTTFRCMRSEMTKKFISYKNNKGIKLKIRLHPKTCPSVRINKSAQALTVLT